MQMMKGTPGMTKGKSVGANMRGRGNSNEYSNDIQMKLKS